MFVHGIRTSSAIWAVQAAAMEQAGHRTVALDLPGHGVRQDETFTLTAAMHTIDEAVGTCAEPPLLVGLSLGGYTCLAYAADHPGRVAGVMLSGCSTEIRGKPVGAYGRVSGRLATLFGRGAGTWHVVTDMLAALHGYSPLADLRRLAVPVWLVNGRRDPLRIDERRYLLAHPGTQLTVVPGAGHDVNTHAPVAFTRELLRVVDELRLRADLRHHQPALV